MTWFTDSPFERMMVQRPKMQRREQTVPAVLLTEQDHIKRKRQQKELCLVIIWTAAYCHRQRIHTIR